MAENLYFKVEKKIEKSLLPFSKQPILVEFHSGNTSFFPVHFGQFSVTFCPFSAKTADAEGNIGGKGGGGLVIQTITIVT